jgi:GMP synthase-like glutamine amidotransferase
MILMKRIHCLQHTESEGPAGLARWAEKRGHELSFTRFYQKEPLPELSRFDVLAIMGGPMNIYQDRDYPWLKSERAFIKSCLQAGKKVIGFCLGAQLIADALGGRVHQHQNYELGWFPVTARSVAGGKLPRFWSAFPSELVALHWHGDTFELPPGAQLLASSECCPHQAFAYGERVLAFQFHLEVDAPDLQDFIGCGSDLNWPGPYVQDEKALWSGVKEHAPQAQAVLAEILDAFVG